MNCEEAHRFFEDFINDRLSVNNTDEFIRHVEGCKDCFDELEVYYMVKAATEELSEGDLKSYDLTHILSEKLAERKKYVRRRQILRFVLAIGAVLLLIAAVYFVFFIMS